MNIITIKTQTELDALPDGFQEYTRIEIYGGVPGDRIIVKKAWENSSVVARENSSVDAWGNSSVVAWENSSVVARENSSVEARENSSVVARENSSVEAWGNSSVVARGNVGVHVQSPYCSLELFAFSVAWLIAKCKVKTHGKKCQTITPVAPEGLEGWFENEAVSVDGKKAILFKRVSADFKTQEGQTNETLWAVGSTLEHKAWSPKDDECGPGKFHACSRPYFCDEFRSLRGDRYVAIEVNVSDLYLWPNGQHPHKIAFRKGTVLHECNKLGKKIA